MVIRGRLCGPPVAGSRERLESIKAGHRSAKPATVSRMEDYLEVIAELVEIKGYATTIDISRYMSVSAPSVTRMLRRLDEKGHLEYEKYHGIHLTEKGAAVAESVRQRHSTLLEFFEMLGVREGTDAGVEGIEHHLDPRAAAQLRKFVAYLRARPAVVEEFRRL